ncbi:hypothetical protein PINS_up023368 [Pythium insidiosum]|nr:hypothetical protein PINS_up023368 [Pythium insidiosum]
MTSSIARTLLPPWILKATADAPAPPAPLRLLPWDDGFTPSGCDGRPGSVVVAQRRSSPEVCRVLDDAVDECTADLLYASAARAKVWGVYVPSALLQSLTRTTRDAMVSGLRHQDETSMTREEKTKYREALAAAAAYELLVENAHDTISLEDWKETHGVAVWVIASDCDDETEYHLDYAEMLRFETNVIFPPLYGATLHVSRGAIEGGGFHVNRRGLEHYREYGYKTRRLSSKLSTDALESVATSHQEPGWTSIPYRFRRGIICDGDFPHFSGRVRALPSAASRADDLPKRRVVVGFNLFPHAIGDFVARYPEHSDAFNRYVKLSQTLFPPAKCRYRAAAKRSPTPKPLEPRDHQAEPPSRLRSSSGWREKCESTRRPKTTTPTMSSYANNQRHRRSNSWTSTNTNTNTLLTNKRPVQRRAP